MSQFQFREIRLEHYRCFDELTLSLEKDTTVLFAGNGGGKTALLTALATGLAAFQVDAAKFAKLDPQRDPTLRTLDDGRRREPAGPCSIEWSAAVGDLDEVTWSTRVTSPPGRAKKAHRPIVEAVDRVRVPGERWPLFAWYGVDRLGRRGRRRIEWKGDRWEGYDHALDPNLDEAMLLQWLQDEMLGDTVRRQHGEPERFFHTAVMDATVRATPDVVTAWYDPIEEGPSVRFEDGHVTPWSELSDGYHVYIALVADIARRAVMLNGSQGAKAMDTVEGVVLIDELDLHLHPSWQRIALPSLRKVFPRLQFVVTTHSPQVLSSAENRQVRQLFDGRLDEMQPRVEGRDTNAILREHMLTDDRDEQGKRKLRDLHAAIDHNQAAKAEQLYRDLLGRWGDLDPALIRARAMMDWDR